MWHKTNMNKVREDLSRLQTEREAEEIVESEFSKYCANCGKPMEHPGVWWEHVSGPPDEDMSEHDREFYCCECIKVDKTRRNKHKAS